MAKIHVSLKDFRKSLNKAIILTEAPGDDTDSFKEQQKKIKDDPKKRREEAKTKYKEEIKDKARMFFGSWIRKNQEPKDIESKKYSEWKKEKEKAKKTAFIQAIGVFADKIYIDTYPEPDEKNSLEWRVWAYRRFKPAPDDVDSQEWESWFKRACSDPSDLSKLEPDNKDSPAYARWLSRMNAAAKGGGIALPTSIQPPSHNDPFTGKIDFKKASAEVKKRFGGKIPFAAAAELAKFSPRAPGPPRVTELPPSSGEVPKPNFIKRMPGESEDAFKEREEFELAADEAARKRARARERAAASFAAARGGNAQAQGTFLDATDKIGMSPIDVEELKEKDKDAYLALASFYEPNADYAPDGKVLSDSGIYVFYPSDKREPEIFYVPIVSAKDYVVQWAPFENDKLRKAVKNDLEARGVKKLSQLTDEEQENFRKRHKGYFSTAGKNFEELSSAQQKALLDERAFIYIRASSHAEAKQKAIKLLQDRAKVKSPWGPHKWIIKPKFINPDQADADEYQGWKTYPGLSPQIRNRLKGSYSKKTIKGARPKYGPDTSMIRGATGPKGGDTPRDADFNFSQLVRRVGQLTPENIKMHSSENLRRAAYELKRKILGNPAFTKDGQSMLKMIEAELNARGHLEKKPLKTTGRGEWHITLPDETSIIIKGLSEDSSKDDVTAAALEKYIEDNKLDFKKDLEQINDYASKLASNSKLEWVPETVTHGGVVVRRGSIRPEDEPTSAEPTSPPEIPRDVLSALNKPGVKPVEKSRPVKRTDERIIVAVTNLVNNVVADAEYEFPKDSIEWKKKIYGDLTDKIRKLQPGVVKQDPEAAYKFQARFLGISRDELTQEIYNQLMKILHAERRRFYDPSIAGALADDELATTSALTASDIQRIVSGIIRYAAALAKVKDENKLSTIERVIEISEKGFKKMKAGLRNNFAFFVFENPEDVNTTKVTVTNVDELEKIINKLKKSKNEVKKY